MLMAIPEWCMYRGGRLTQCSQQMNTRLSIVNMILMPPVFIRIQEELYADCGGKIVEWCVLTWREGHLFYHGPLGITFALECVMSEGHSETNDYACMYKGTSWTLGARTLRALLYSVQGCGHLLWCVVHDKQFPPCRTAMSRNAWKCNSTMLAASCVMLRAQTL